MMVITESGKMIVCSLVDSTFLEVPCSTMNGKDPEEVGYPPFYKGCTCTVIPCHTPYRGKKPPTDFDMMRTIQESEGENIYGDSFYDFE